MIKRWLFLLLLLAACLLPVALLLISGFAGTWRYPDLLPSTWSLRAFDFIRSQAKPIAASLASSVGYSLATAAVAFLLCVGPASVLARERFPGRRLLEALFLAPALVPPIAFTMGIHSLFLRVGLADTAAGIVLVLALFSSPYMLRALVIGFLAFGPGYAACAANLGASPLRRLFRVELPLLVPAAVSGATVVFLVAISDYFLVFLVGGGVVPSFTGYLVPYLTSSERPTGALLSLVFLAVPILLFGLVDLTVTRQYRRRGMME